ncbi:MAG: glycosyltransferase family 2 protein [Verrucomicrobia bacterium]|nr:glycosyltransferase family 2 protein [Verrucomicrobiota bacterium]
MREKISVCITAGNEEKNIRRCLESVKWADEIIVVDSFSTDRTVEICLEYTDMVYRHRWLGYIGQKNLIKDLAEGPWILFIDADEEISPELRDEITGEFEGGSAAAVAGYEFPRMVWYMNQWIRHGDWYPDAKLRLFRKDHGRCGGREPHDRTTVDGPVKRMVAHMYHYTYTDIADQLATINHFSTITAEGWFHDGKPFRWFDLVLRPPFRFFRCYLFKRGFMDGFSGVIIAMFAAYGVFVKYAKLWELHVKKDMP